MSGFKAREATLQNLFDSGDYDQFVIPHYQRSYVWGQDELENFWNDFIERKEVGQLYLLGSVIVSRTKQKRSFGVVDGQQRLITSSVFITALKDVWGEKFGRDEEYFSLERFIKKKVLGSNNAIFKIDVAGSLKRCYIDMIISGSIKKEYKNEDQKNLHRAYNYFKDKLRDSYDANKANDSQRKKLLLQKLENLLDTNLVLVILDDEDDAYEVFEGFNARGVDLSISDLFKNLFLQKIKGTEEEKARALDEWDNIIQIVTELRIPKFTINTFIRYYWIRNHSFIGERQLYKKIKKETKNYRELLSDMHQIAEALRVLFNGSPYEIRDFLGHPEAKAEYAKSISDSLRALRVMNTQSYMVWLMSIAAKRNKEFISLKMFARSLGQIERFSFRYFVVSKLPANRVEKMYAKFSNELFKLSDTRDKQRIATLLDKELLNRIEQDKLLPPREQFIADFGLLCLKSNNKNLVRYILTQIENQLSSGEKGVTQEVVTIEHIMPQRLNKGWNISQTDHKNCVNMLGNLTILKGASNSSASNKAINEKIRHFKDSDLKMNGDLVDLINKKSDWGKDEIIERQNAFAEASDGIWSVDKR